MDKTDHMTMERNLAVTEYHNLIFCFYYYTFKKPLCLKSLDKFLEYRPTVQFILKCSPCLRRCRYEPYLFAIDICIIAFENFLGISAQR